MIRVGTTRDLYTGRGGQLATMAELLMRRCNVAIPEVDEGEDMLAFLVEEPEVARLQVKTAQAEPLKTEGCYAARVSVPLAQLERRLRTKLYYVFAIRLGECWSDFLVISRLQLHRLSQDGTGYINRKAGELQLYCSFSQDEVTCSGRSWQSYRNAWDAVPTVIAAARS
jgi:hypothetical protein